MSIKINNNDELLDCQSKIDLIIKKTIENEKTNLDKSNNFKDVPHYISNDMFKKITVEKGIDMYDSDEDNQDILSDTNYNIINEVKSNKINSIDINETSRFDNKENINYSCRSNTIKKIKQENPLSFRPINNKDIIDKIIRYKAIIKEYKLNLINLLALVSNFNDNLDSDIFNILSNNEIKSEDYANLYSDIDNKVNYSLNIINNIVGELSSNLLNKINIIEQENNLNKQNLNVHNFKERILCINCLENLDNTNNIYYSLLYFKSKVNILKKDLSDFKNKYEVIINENKSDKEIIKDLYSKNKYLQKKLIKYKSIVDMQALNSDLNLINMQSQINNTCNSLNTSFNLKHSSDFFNNYKNLKKSLDKKYDIKV